MTTKSEGYGFLRASKARHAEEAIGHSEGLVAVLRLTQADLQPAEESLKVAKELFRAHEFSKAITAARRAESLAITLDERFSAYVKARKALQIRVGELRRIGLHVEDLQEVLGSADALVAKGSWESGSLVPNYLEARVLLEKAAEQGLNLLMKANAASNRIFLAELAIEALADTGGLTDPKAFEEGTLAALEASLEDATRELALGNVDAATRIATEAEGRAEHLHAVYRESGDLLDRLATRLGVLRGEGIVTDSLDRQISYARSMRGKGILEPALEMARRLTDETTKLTEMHAKAATGLQDAEVLYAQLAQEGFHSYEADAALKDARRALREGNYGRTLEHIERAHGAFVRRRNAREALAKALSETQRRVEILKTIDIPFLPDVKEILGRAEREFRQGNYSGSSEDLQIAAALLNQDPKSRPPERRA